MEETTKYITIKEAAKLLNVTPLTLRNWDKSGKLVASRHPMNGYRVYKLDQIKQILSDIESGRVPVRAKKQGPKKLVVKHLPY